MTFYAHHSQVPASAWPWRSFTPAEIACRGTGKLMVNERAMDMLQDLRDRLGAPMVINSGYRSPEHNRAVGGAPQSKHMQGIAFDVSMAGHDPQVFMATARAVGFKGIGEYPVLGFCHIDARRDAASWTGSRGKRFPGAPKAPKPITSPRAPITQPAQRPSDGLAALLRGIIATLKGKP